MYSSTQPRGPVDDADPPPSEQPSAPSAHTRTTEADTGAGPWDDLDAAFDAVSEKSFLTRSAAAESVFTTASKSAQAGVDGALPRATSAQNVQARESETDSGFPWASLDAAADADAVAVARSDAGSESFSKRESASADVGQGSAEGDAQSPRALTSRSSSNSNAQLTGPTKTPIGIALMPIMHSQLPSQPPNTPPPTTENAPKLTHVDAATGRASMVDVGHKSHTRRSATAIGRVYLPPIALQLIRSNEVGPAHSQSDRLTSPAWRQAAGKGPVLHTAQLAGIMAAKRTSELIPLCHSLPLSSVDVRFELVDPVDPVDPSADGANEHEPEPEPEEEGAWKLGQRGYVSITCTAHTSGQTGVEMEALMGVNVAALTVWDMVKAVAGRQMVVGDVMVVRKSGGKSGDWVRE